jgi:hypothetical protein
LNRFREAILQGTPWHLALLKAIGEWTLPREVIDGRQYVYLLHGEAFDWLLLAERLCAAANGLIPQDEHERLVFKGLLPQEVDKESFRWLVGEARYRAILNFWYGVVVEEALQLATEEKLRKEERAKGHPDSDQIVERAFRRLYGETRTTLLKAFRKEMAYPQRKSITLTEIREFNYWLFKHRIATLEPARVASDTRRGITRLKKLRGNSFTL